MNDAIFIFTCVALYMLFMGEPNLFDRIHEYLMTYFEVVK
jgi:hypothetical protein